MRFFALTCLAVLALTATAQAFKRSHTSRVANMREIALRYWGDITDTCDHSVMDIPIERTRIPPRRDENGQIVFTYNGRFVHRIEDSDDPPFHDCRIMIQDRPWNTDDLCRVVVHEMGHAAGWRAPQGQAFVWPDGTVDDWHSNDPTSLMWPFELAYFAPCENGAADT